MSKFSMYKVKPYYNFSGEISPSDVMYKMPRLVDSSTIGVAEASPELLSLKQRQNELLSKLDGLIDEISTAQHNCLNESLNKSKSLMDVVIHVNPKKNPRSLKFIHRLLQRKLRVLLKTHFHSTLSNSNDAALLVTNEESGDRSSYDIVITIIYTETVNEPVAILKPSSSNSIHGESNIARLFGRLMLVYDGGPSTFQSTTQTDVFFDASDVITSSVSTQSEKQSAIRTLDNALQRNACLCGAESSLADAVALSALIQTNLSLPSQAGKRWMQVHGI